MKLTILVLKLDREVFSRIQRLLSVFWRFQMVFRGFWHFRNDSRGSKASFTLFLKGQKFLKSSQWHLEASDIFKMILEASKTNFFFNQLRHLQKFLASFERFSVEFRALWQFSGSCKCYLEVSDIFKVILDASSTFTKLLKDLKFL